MATESVEQNVKGVGRRRSWTQVGHTDGGWDGTPYRYTAERWTVEIIGEHDELSDAARQAIQEQREQDDGRWQTDVNDDLSTMPCCDYRDHGVNGCACPEHAQSELHPFGFVRTGRAEGEEDGSPWDA